MILTYKYRAKPTRAQHAVLDAVLEDQRLLYNAALEERIGCYRLTGKGRTFYDQCVALTEWRREDKTARTTPLCIQRWTLRRLDDAYKAFFRRVKARAGRAGFPRFRNKTRWHSFGFSEMDGLRWDGKRLRWRGLPGGLRVHLHRPMAGELRACVFRRDHKGWSVCFQVLVDDAERRPVATSVGLDIGLSVFAHCSDGAVLPNPRIARRAERELRRRQRALARCKRGSMRRRKVRARVARLHAKIAATRATWLHQQSAALVRRYDLIAAEDLNVSGMIRNPRLARSIADASWSTFLTMVSYKAERAGGTFVTVDPRNTSQRCSVCGELVPKALAVRIHACPHCGLVIDRDWNAARNILAAVVSGGQQNVAQWGKRAAGSLAMRRDTTQRRSIPGAM